MYGSHTMYKPLNNDVSVNVLVGPTSLDLYNLTKSKGLHHTVRFAVGLTPVMRWPVQPLRLSFACSRAYQHQNGAFDVNGCGQENNQTEHLMYTASVQLTKHTHCTGDDKDRLSGPRCL